MLFAAETSNLRDKFMEAYKSVTYADMSELQYADFKSAFDTWWGSVPKPWRAANQTPTAWAYSEIKQRFCNWWIFIHNSDYWFLDNDDLGFSDRLDWY